MILLTIGHLLGDFYFQTNELAKKKREKIRYILIHCAIYVLIMYLFVTFQLQSFEDAIVPAALIGLLHLWVDSIKIAISEKYRDNPKIEIVLFGVDQAIHMICIIAIVIGYCITLDVSKFSFLPLVVLEKEKLLLVVICLMLALGAPTAVLIALVFKMIPITVRKADGLKINEENFEGKQTNVLEHQASFKEGTKIGTWIGILEREIIFMLGMLGQYEAIGFVIAAKSIARYGQLDNKDFAEKYLIGTLLSAFVAILSVFVCKYIMGM